LSGGSNSGFSTFCEDKLKVRRQQSNTIVRGLTYCFRMPDVQLLCGKLHDFYYKKLDNFLPTINSELRLFDERKDNVTKSRFYGTKRVEFFMLKSEFYTINFYLPKNYVMKPLKITFQFLAIILLLSFNRLNAQSYQFEWTNTFDGTEVDNPGWCLWHVVKGYYTYHVTMHVDPKTGLVDRVHNNVVNYDLTDMSTNKKLVLIDTGHDTFNKDGNFYFWNWITGANLPIGEDIPVEGTMVWATFKWISPGGLKVTTHEVFQLHMDANGVMRVEKDKPYADCN